MKVVSDTSCITTLLKVEQVDLLRILFGSILVLSAVAEELAHYHPKIPEFVTIHECSADPLLSGIEHLGRGEAQAIRLCKNITADLFLSDDRKAIQTARALEIPSAGLVALLVHAKRLKHIPSVSKYLELLQQKGGLYLSDSVKNAARRMVGE